MVMAEVNLDQDFLMRFSCMGTQDKDVLISQLHILLDSQLSREGCEFFLDMTNWNLQAAVGAFYDYYSNEGGVLPEMTLVNSKGSLQSYPGVSLTRSPNSVFTETWTLTNRGTRPWPSGVHWILKTGGELCTTHDMPLPLLPPGGDIVVSIEFHCPSSPGVYHCQWRACTSGGALFGDPAWVIVRVQDSEEEEEMSGLVHQLSSITTQEGDMEMESSKIHTIEEETRQQNTMATRPQNTMATNPFNNTLYQEHPFSTGSMMTNPGSIPAGSSSIPTGLCLERLLQPMEGSSPGHTEMSTIGSNLVSVVTHADSTSMNCSIPVPNENQSLEPNSNNNLVHQDHMRHRHTSPPGVEDNTQPNLTK